MLSAFGLFIFIAFRRLVVGIVWSRSGWQTVPLAMDLRARTPPKKGYADEAVDELESYPENFEEDAPVSNNAGEEEGGSPDSRRKQKKKKKKRDDDASNAESTRFRAMDIAWLILISVCLFGVVWPVPRKFVPGTFKAQIIVGLQVVPGTKLQLQATLVWRAALLVAVRGRPA